MNNKSFYGLSFIALGMSMGQVAVAVEQKPEGFIEGSSFNILNRNLYFNRDFRNGQSSRTGNGYSEEWAHGIIGRFESGFTQGTVGFGIDAFAMQGIKLDSGDGRSGAGGTVDIMPYNSKGQPEDTYSKVGGAAKLRLLDTVIKVGNVFPSTPVVAYGDSRLLPESFRGATFANTSIEGLTLQGGRLHAMSQPNSSSMRDGFATFYAGSVDAPWIAYLGGDYAVNKNVGVSLYTSRFKDVWNQYYAGTTLSYPLSENVALIGGLNYYRAVDEGKKLLGSFDNNIWSGKTGVQFGAHTLSVGYQRSNGDDDFDYLRQSDSIFLDNSIQYSDFNSPKEQSLQLRYDLNMQPFGIPGLSFMTRYAKGWDADYSNANSVYMRRGADGAPLQDQKRWERDIEAKYIIQTGSLKDMSFRVRQATTRATAFESDLNEVRLIVEYPLQIL
ncbi:MULTISPECIES: OprD family porin [unclassified Pseudomonas]|uniref:OprD family porin n=1 Tax=unclassified Pseudomonas TaxID=196821 RepID=UPI000C869E70|nr:MULTISPECIES: OprD family porin [unclassified Pseudomonas]PMV91904.1 outer membrane porin, OprD family [Pseudomonas sp. GW460-C8]PMW23448.1 outer membrane porin, OprD family [Pseudomonas sp. GW456-E6]PMW24076.1 outer membrane porin, OprD family [Pseudomonas sp. GW456-11-11-14-TSB2]PMW39970.1 outer membrane porin, OprD family [Pseudomonas sp. GW460-7]PMW41081.1 outer membrane porin, OprD family [Pseudomonas sp. FW305-3-2-15-A-R2A1]